MSGDRAQKKTERSHEENQERAYIAASRRADRSLEARVQSARMASEIHKRRTGKAFKVTEEIVLKEEMYEEEDDDFPRNYRTLVAYQQTANAGINDRLSHYIQTDLAAKELARVREIERQFAETFPTISRGLPSYHMSYAGEPQTHQPQPNPLPQPEPPNRGYSHSPMLDYSSQFGRERSHSISQPSPVPDLATRRHTIAVTATSHMQQSGASGDESGSVSSLSPPALTPGSGSSTGSSSAGTGGGRCGSVDTPMTTDLTPNFTSAGSYPSISATTSMDDYRRLAMCSIPGMAPPSYTDFTSGYPSQMESPQTSQMTTGWPGSGGLYQEPQLYRDNIELEPTANTGFGGYDPMATGVRAAAKAPQPHVLPVTSAATTQEYFHPGAHSLTATAGPNIRFDGISGPRSTVGTPGGGPGCDNFDAFFDMEQYSAADPAAWSAPNAS